MAPIIQRLQEKWQFIDICELAQDYYNCPSETTR